MSYTYDAAGNLTELGYPPNNRKVKYTYDNLNRLSTVTIDWVSGKPTMRYIYDDANRLDRIEHFNAMETDYIWDAANRLTGIAHNGPTNLVAYNFTLDKNGNRIQETVSPEPVMPGTLASDDTSFAYNTPRNRLNATSKPTYHYDQGQLTGNVNTIANQYTYDDEGQLTGKGTTSYTFDDAHRLIQRGTDTFTYDGVGNRIKATRGSAQAHYIYDAAGNLLAQANATTGAIQRYFIYGAGLAAMQVGSNYYTYHFDGTGHTVALTDKNNLVTHKYAYSPYGKVLGQVEAISQPFKYAGQVGIFAETDNVYYMRARYYDAETGRFISEDPAGFIDGPNLYAYVGGNPVRYLDPSGRAAIGLAGGIDVNFNLFGIPIDATGSVSVVMDDSGDLQVYGTPEAGYTTSQKPGANGFLRAIVAPAQNVKVSSFGGVAPSFSGTLGRVSGSVTFTGDGNIYEFGVAYPGGGRSGSVTVGIGIPLTSALHHGGGGTFAETYRQAVHCP